MKKLLSAACVAFSLAAICSSVVRADETVVARIGGVDYTDLQKALDDVGLDETITLVSDFTNLNITAATYLSFASGKRATLDLNGKTIYGENALESTSTMLQIAGDLVIKDTSEGQEGRIAVRPLKPAAYESSGGTYSYGSYLFNIKSGSLTIDGGTFENLGVGAVCYVFEMGESGLASAVTVNDGFVNAQGTVARMFSLHDSPVLSFTVNGGKIESKHGAGIQFFGMSSEGSGRGAISIAGGEIIAPSYAVYAYGTDGGLTVDMTGGKVTSTGSNAAAFCLYNYRARAFDEPTALDVSGGTVSGVYALSVIDYYAATHTTISGGDFSGQFYVWAYDKSYPYYDPSAYPYPWRTDEYCVRVTGGNFADFDVEGDSWFWVDELSGVLLYGGTYDATLALTDDVRYMGRVASGYGYRDNHDGTWTVVPSIVAKPTPVGNTKVEVYTNGFLSAEMSLGSGEWYAWSNTTAQAVYTAAEGYFFAGDVSVVTNDLDATKNPATGPAPDLPTKDVEGVPCAKDDETNVVPSEKPAETTPEVWAGATNLVATATTADAPVIVADSELTNAVIEAKKLCTESQVVTKLLAGVEVAVKPTGAEADAKDDIRMIKMDVTPYLTTWAEISDGETVTTNLVGAASREFEYSGRPMRLSFNVSSMADEPVLIIHRHGEQELRYTRGTEATETTFAYDADAGTVTLLMSVFSELEIRSGVQVGDNAFATVDKQGVCTVFGTGDMWSYGKPGVSPLWDYRSAITRVVVGEGVTGVGANFFAYMKGVKDVSIGGAVTNVADNAFFHCSYVTNLVVGAGVRTVGTNAFDRCYSAESISFGSVAVAEACQGAYKIVARITMVGGTPVVDTVPTVTIEGCNKVLKGKAELADAEWTVIKDPNDIPSGLHFFQYEYRPVE